MHHRVSPPSRKAVVGGACAAALLSLGLAGPAATGAAAAPAASTSSASPTGTAMATGTVSRFYNGYLCALDEGDSNRARTLRKSNLRSDFRRRLAHWEEMHSADGVLRAQNVPVGADVTYDGSGAGHSWSIVTLHWKGGEPTRLHVQTDAGTRKISDIRSMR